MAKILIHSLIFSPDGVSTAYLYSDIARRLHDEGHEVVVLSTTPHYNIVEEEPCQAAIEMEGAGDMQDEQLPWHKGVSYTSEKIQGDIAAPLRICLLACDSIYHRPVDT